MGGLATGSCGPWRQRARTRRTLRSSTGRAAAQACAAARPFPSLHPHDGSL